MKTTVSLMMVVLFALTCHGASPRAQPQVLRSGVPAAHSLSVDAGFVATDLSHGNGPMHLALTRRWSGSDTLNTRFGRGWSDQNDLQLRLLNPDLVIILRGGVGWRDAYKKTDALFESAAGEKIERTDKGWTAQMPHGVTLTFDPAGRLLARREAEGPSCNYTYDGNGRLISLGTGPGNLLRYDYTYEGWVTSVRGPEGLRVDYTYNDEGQLTAVLTAKQERIDYQHGADGKLTAARDQFGTELDLSRPSAVASQPAQSKQQALGVSGATTAKYSFDGQGRTKAVTEGGSTKTYRYDQSGLLAEIATPEARTTCKYDGFGRVTTVESSDGTAARFEYNGLDLPTAIAKPDGTTERIQYDEHGRVLRRERSPIDWEEFAYDPAGRVATHRSAPAAEEHYTFGDNDRLARIKYDNGREVAFEYDAAGRLLSETASSGEKRSWRYDSDGRPLEVVSPTGLKTSYLYNQDGELIGSDDKIHGKTFYRRLPNGDVVESAEGKTTRTLTTWGKPLKIVQPGGARRLFSYDARGLLQQVLSPTNLPWRYEYDPSRHLTSIIAPSGLRTSIAWDAAGRRLKVARGATTWREYRYNPAGQLEQESSGAGRAARYGHAPDGQVSQIEFPDGKVTFTRSDDGRHVVEKSPSYEIENDYAGDGTLLRRTYTPAGLALKLPVDSAGRPAGIELNGIKVTYAYDSNGQLTKLNLPSGSTIALAKDEAGRPTQITFGNHLIKTVGYDRADRIVSIEVKQGSGKSIFAEHYAYDAAGNLSQRTTGSGPPANYEYDREGRLARAARQDVSRSYRYDADGNLTTDAEGKRCHLDRLGRPVDDEATAFTWDAAGNLKEVRTLKSTIENAFDAAGRLVEHRDGKNTWKFGYDAAHDRLWQESQAGKRWFAYLDDRLAGFKDETGTSWLIVSYPGTDQPLALCGSNGTTVFVIADRLGSARRFLDASGAVVGSDDYAAFGAVLGSTGKKPISLYAGMVRDDTGLCYARQRYYEPSIARFISLDPFTGTQGDPASHNAYAYAANNPLRYRDPMGTDFESEVVWDWANPGIKNNAYDALTQGEKAATRQAYEGAQAARRVLQNPASTASETKAAAEALAQSEAALARLNQIGRLRYGHALLTAGELRGWGGANSSAKIAEYSEKLKQLGVDPMEPYSPAARAQIAQHQAEKTAAQEAAETAAADEAAREARRAWGVGKSNTLQVPKSEAGEGAAEAAGQKTGAVQAGEAAGEAVEGAASWFARGAKGVLRAAGPLLQALGIAADIHTIAETDYYFAKMYGSGADALEAKQLGKAIREKLEEEIKRIAREEPDRLLPLPDGRKVDPNNPQDIDEVIIGMHLNLWEKKGAFDGLIKPKDFAADAAKQGDNLAAGHTAAPTALAGAWKLMQTAIQAEKDAMEAAKECIRQQTEAQSQLQNAVTIAGARGVVVAEAGLANLPVSADDVKTQTAAVVQQTKALGQAYDAMSAAVDKCDDTALKVCEWANQATAGATAEQIADLRTKATNELASASNLLNDAQARLDAADFSLDQLRASKAALEGFRTALELSKAGSGVADAAAGKPDEALAAAKTAAKAASEARAKLDALVGQVTSIGSQVAGMLAPSIGFDPEAAALAAAAQALGNDIPDPGPFDFSRLLGLAGPFIDAFISNQKALEKAIGNVDLEGLVNAAGQALDAADAARQSAKQLATGPDRYHALQNASFCFALIQSANPATADADTSASAADSDQVTVPDLSAFDNVSEMKAALAHAGLVGAFSAKGTPPSKELEFKFAGQSPAADTKVKHGSTVSVSIYQSFEPGAEAKDVMPNLKGLTLDQAMSRLGKNMRIGSDEVGTKPGKPEEAYTIYDQNPPAGAKMDTSKEVLVTVKRYGSAKTEETVQPPAPSGTDLMAEIEKKYKHFYLKGDEAKKQGLDFTDWQLSIRTRRDGKTDYFFNNDLMRMDKTAGGKLYLTDTKGEWGSMVVEVHDDFARVTRTVEVNKGTASQSALLVGPTEKKEQTATLPRSYQQLGRWIEATYPESPEDLKRIEQWIGSPH